MKKIQFTTKTVLSLTAMLIAGAILGSASVAQQKAVVTIWWPQGDNERKSLEQAVADYQKVEPNVEIKPVFQASSDDLQKLQVAYAGGSAPDIARIDSVYVPNLGNQGLFLDLNKYGAAALKSKFFTSVWNTNVLGDKTYGLPFDCSTLMLMYNKKLLTETKTKPPKTYEELIAAAKANTRETANGKIWGYTVPNSPQVSGWVQYQFSNYIWRSGGDILSPDGKTAIYNSPAAVKALEKLIAPAREYKVAPENAFYQEQFVAGTVAFMDMGPWLINGLQDKGFDYVPLPTLEAGVPTTTSLGAYTLGVFSTSKQPEAAFKFAKFFTTTPKYMADFAKRTFLLPSLRASFNDPELKKAPWSTFRQTLPAARPRPSTAAWPQIADHMAAAIQAAFLGKDPKVALDEAVAKSNAALAAIK